MWQLPQTLSKEERKRYPNFSLPSALSGSIRASFWPNLPRIQEQGSRGSVVRWDTGVLWAARVGDEQGLPLVCLCLFEYDTGVLGLDMPPMCACHGSAARGDAQL